MRVPHSIAATLLVVGVAVTGCGGDDGPDGGAPVDRAAPVKKIALSQNSRDVAVGEGSVWVVGVNDLLTQVDPSSNEIVRELPIESAKSVAVGGGFVWVIDFDAQRLTKVEPRSGRSETFPLARAGSAVVADVAVGHGRVWVSTSGNYAVSTVDPRSGKVVGRPIPVPGAPVAITVGRDAVFVGTVAEGLVEIDPSTRRVRRPHFNFLGSSIEAIATGAGATWVISDEDEADFNDDYVEKVELIPNGGPAGRDTERLVNDARDVAVDASSLWALGGLESKLFRLDPTKKGLNVLSEFKVPEEPSALALGEGSVWVVSSREETLLRVDASAD